MKSAIGLYPCGTNPKGMAIDQNTIGPAKPANVRARSRPFFFKKTLAGWSLGADETRHRFGVSSHSTEVVTDDAAT